MDFVKILRSLEEFLYEVMSWLAFYPRTLVRIVRHPVASARYVAVQRGQPQDQQFTEAISPPLILVLSILLAHTVEIAITPPLRLPSGTLTELVFGTQQGLLLFRSLCFAVLALVAALSTLRRSGQRLDRDTLRMPFYVQCFLAAPFALVVSTALTITRAASGTVASLAVAVAALSAGWYVRARACVYRQLHGGSLARSLVIASANFVGATIAIVLVTALLVSADTAL